MKRLALLIAFALSCVLAHAQNTTITASHIQVFGGQAVTGSFCVTPTDSNGYPITLNANTQQLLSPTTPECFPISAGVLSNSAIVPDVSLTNPANACYLTIIKDNFGNKLAQYPCLQPTGTTWSFDAYVPTTLPNTTAVTLPQFQLNGTSNPVQSYLDLVCPQCTVSGGHVTLTSGVPNIAQNTMLGNITNATTAAQQLSQSQVLNLLGLNAFNFGGPSGALTAWTVPNNTLVGNVSGVTGAPYALNQTQIGTLFSGSFDAAGAATNAQNASLQKTANLGDLASASSARTNLGLGAMATQAGPSFVVNPQTATYQVLGADFAACKTIPVASGTFTITLPPNTSQPANGQCIDVINYGTGTVTIARYGQNINGATTNLSLSPGTPAAPTSVHIVSDGTNYEATPLNEAIGGSTGQMQVNAGGNALAGFPVFYADYFPGSDCGAQVGAALTAIGSNPGNVEVSRACGGGAGLFTTAVTVGANQHLRLRAGVYGVSAPITLGANATVECDPVSDVDAGTGSCIFHENNGANLPEVFLLSGNYSALLNVTVDGNYTNNPSASQNILVTGLRARLEYVNTINARTAGIYVGGTNTTSNVGAAAKLSHIFAVSNNGNGVTCYSSSDLFIGDQSEIENNTGYGVSAYDCGGTRIDHNDISGNHLDNLYIAGNTTGAQGAFNHLITANMFSMGYQNDIEIAGWDPSSSYWASEYNGIVGNIFQSSTNHGNQTYDAIKITDSGFNTISGNTFMDVFGAPYLYKNGIEIIQAHTEQADTIVGNSIGVTSPIVAVASTIQANNNLNGSSLAAGQTAAIAMTTSTATIAPTTSAVVLTSATPTSGTFLTMTAPAACSVAGQSCQLTLLNNTGASITTGSGTSAGNFAAATVLPNKSEMVCNGYGSTLLWYCSR